MRTLAVVNQKGGVGKTTTAVNLAATLAERGQRVLLIDLDPQGHAAPSLGIHSSPEAGIDSVLMRDEPLENHGLAVRERLLLVPSGSTLEAVAAGAAGPQLAYRLDDVLRAQTPPVDFCVIDCPPASSLVAANGIIAATDVLVPVAGDYLALTGVARLLMTLKRLEPLRRGPLNRWFFMCRYMPRRRLAQEVREKVRQHFGQEFVDSCISEAAVVAECAAAGLAVCEHPPARRAAEEFGRLADHFITTNGSNNGQQQVTHVA
jgi:chromosome partitioning protein